MLLAKSARYDMGVCRSGSVVMGKYGCTHGVAMQGESLKTGDIETRFIRIDVMCVAASSMIVGHGVARLVKGDSNCRMC